MVSTRTSCLLEQTSVNHSRAFCVVSVCERGRDSFPAPQGGRTSAGEDSALRCSRSLGSETGPLLGHLPEAWLWLNYLTSPKTPLLYLKMGMIVTHK